MVCLKNFLRTQHHYFIPIRVGNTSTQNTGDCYLNTTLLKACPEKETVWITELWKTSSADLKLKCSMVKNLKVLTLSLMNLKNTFITTSNHSQTCILNWHASPKSSWRSFLCDILSKRKHALWRYAYQNIVHDPVS
mgnify:CR=1 FL=1